MSILIAILSSSLPVLGTQANRATHLPAKEKRAIAQTLSNARAERRRKEMARKQQCLHQEAEKFCASCCGPAVQLEYFNILQARLETGLPLRGYFVEVLLKYIRFEGGTVRLDKHFTDVQFPFILEVLISILYYDNQILDRKYGINTLQRIGENLAKRNRLYDALLKYLRKDIENKEIAEQVMDLVQEMHEMVSIGQEWEREYNHYDSWQLPDAKDIHDFYALSGKKIEKEVVFNTQKVLEGIFQFPIQNIPFLDAYLSRIYMTNASLFVKTTEFILQNSSLKPEVKQNILCFSGLFGMMLQIVNDNADFVPESEGLTTSSKLSADALSDLRNTNITLPIALHLIRSKESKVKDFLDAAEQQPTLAEAHHVYSKEIADSQAIYYSMSIGKALEKHALSLLNPQNPAFENFKDMTGVAGNNKYYRYFYGLKEQYRRYQNEKETPHGSSNQSKQS
jgi:geranylgeranyl pyrophosphate synthase